MRIVTLVTALAAVLVLAATALADGPALPVKPGTVLGTDFSATPNPALTGQSIKFDGSGSKTGCVGALGSCEADTWEWSFGDGATATTPVANHAYSSPGTYTVTLRACYCHYTSNWRSQTHTVTVVGP